MEYVDRRGVHACVTGESPPGGAEAGRAESVARMGAMVDGVPWMRAATETGQAILKSLSRAGAVPGLYGHQLSYVTSPFRQIVKELTGSVPKKTGRGCLGPGAARQVRDGLISARPLTTCSTPRPASRTCR